MITCAVAGKKKVIKMAEVWNQLVGSGGISRIEAARNHQRHSGVGIAEANHDKHNGDQERSPLGGKGGGISNRL